MLVIVGTRGDGCILFKKPSRDKIEINNSSTFMMTMMMMVIITCQ